jgi:hypothetical protein
MAFRLVFERFSWKVIRSYTFRATLPQKYENVIRSYTFLLRSYTFRHAFLKILFESYTFLYVPCNPPVKSMKSCHESIRSYTFRANLPQKYRFALFSYTFLYVLCNPGQHPLAISQKYSLRGSNPRPMAHKTIALTTELREPLHTASRNS